MMKLVLDFAKQVVSLASDMRQCKADIKRLEQGDNEIRQELRDLTAVVQRLAYEMQRNHDNEQHEREKLLLRLELLLRTENRLPPVNPLSESEKDTQIAALKQENEELKQRLAALEAKQGE